MNDDLNKSLDERVSRLLKQTRLEPVLPPRFQESVWRRIERQELPASFGASWLDQIAAALLRPRQATAVVIVLLLFGGFLGAVDGAGHARDVARDRYVASVAPVTVH
jgi:hypothetical protein